MPGPRFRGRKEQNCWPEFPRRFTIVPVKDTSDGRLAGLFITGTDTGVGKTLLTSLLLSHLRRRKVPTYAIKPFCSGSRADAQLLHSLQGDELTLDEINPFFFSEPLAPLVAARQLGHSIHLGGVLAHIRSIIRRLPQSKIQNPKSKILPPVLLIEGAGGLLVPLGPKFSILDLIRELCCEVIVVSCNKLGTLNHTMLTVQALESKCPYLRQAQSAHGRQKAQRPKEAWSDGRASVKLVLMQQPRNDASAASNPDMLSELLAPVRLWKLPFFRGKLESPRAIQRIEKKIEKTLAQILV